MTSTITQLENRFFEIEGMNDEIAMEITDYIRQYYSSGPSFYDLREILIRKFDMEESSKFFIQLEVIFRESLIEGFSSTLYHSEETETETQRE